MATESFENDSIGWQIQLLRQNISEWWELQTSKLELPEFPQWQMSGLDQVARVIGWTIAILVAIWFSWRLADLLVPYLYRIFGPTAVRVQETTLTPRLSVEEWLKRSRQFQKGGNYGEACRCLYLAMLQGLNDRGIIPHQPSLTDREYQALLQQDIQNNAYQTLLQTHEKFYFGNQVITSDTWSECQQAYREIERKS
ncbi:DUF4129 domain-containing protein [Oscillatoria acuminata]|uniref:Protein-glutamine gamma-glutamyltransferase-like C-terminal domain-containing protein n=1 Tax=Oscillatoria acuminata PCC 6304 TaxID=56110 RepID=K9TMK2_9CYAN|nr:DUF4129 domain-containing protein [Oscillatoria acuminata]AFY83643.1 hypothetical protein Oscil6304_4114 [Oscillatoria acuminata PCC 6304]